MNHLGWGSMFVLFAVSVGCSNGRSIGGAQQQTHSMSVDSLRCGQQGSDHRCAVYDVSLYELIASPLTFHGKHVRVIGFAHLEFEGNGLYAHREDWERGISRNGLWLNAPIGSDSLSDHYVLAEGRFEATMRGHMGMWSGTLDSVTHLQRWEFPPDPPQLDSSGTRPVKHR
jgi:hypothetical protein